MKCVVGVLNIGGKSSDKRSQDNCTQKLWVDKGCWACVSSVGDRNEMYEVW